MHLQEVAGRPETRSTREEQGLGRHLLPKLPGGQVSAERIAKATGSPMAANTWRSSSLNPGGEAAVASGAPAFVETIPPRVGSPAAAMIGNRGHDPIVAPPERTRNAPSTTGPRLRRWGDYHDRTLVSEDSPSLLAGGPLPAVGRPTRYSVARSGRSGDGLPGSRHPLIPPQARGRLMARPPLKVGTRLLESAEVAYVEFSSCSPVRRDDVHGRPGAGA